MSFESRPELAKINTEIQTLSPGLLYQFMPASKGSSCSDSSMSNLELPYLQITGEIDPKSEKFPIGDKDNEAEKPKPEKEETKWLDPARYAEIAKNVIKKINPSGTVNKNEIIAALQDPSFVGEQAQVLSSLYRNFEKIIGPNYEYSPDENGETLKISLADLDNLQIGVNLFEVRKSEIETMKIWAESRLKGFATDGLALTKDDISKALTSAATSDQDKQVLRLVEKYFDKLVLDGKKSCDIPSFASLSEKQFYTPDGERYGWASATKAGELSSTNHDLYASKNVLDSIKPDAIRQGDSPDCHFLAALAAVANAHPELIRDAIKENSDGTFTVTFAGDKKQSYTVTRPTQAELDIYNQGSQFGIWASVMEKAFGLYQIRNNRIYDIPETLQLAAGGSGGAAEDSIKLLTGQTVKTTQTKEGTDSVVKALTAAFDGGLNKSVTASVSARADGKERSRDGYPARHAYTILGFKPDGKGGGMVTIRNPYGDSHDQPGVSEISVDKFMKNFNRVSVEKAP